MLVRFAIVLMLCALAVTPAKAASASMQCKEPAQPAGLSDNPETPANDMNARITAYNNYVKASNAYMDCLTKQSSGSDAAQAQALIDAQKQKVEAARVSVFSPSK